MQYTNAPVYRKSHRRPVAVAKAVNPAPAFTAFAAIGSFIIFASLALHALL